MSQKTNFKKMQKQTDTDTCFDVDTVNELNNWKNATKTLTFSLISPHPLFFSSSFFIFTTWSLLIYSAAAAPLLVCLVQLNCCCCCCCCCCFFFASSEGWQPITFLLFAHLHTESYRETDNFRQQKLTMSDSNSSNG